MKQENTNPSFPTSKVDWSSSIRCTKLERIIPVAPHTFQIQVFLTSDFNAWAASLFPLVNQHLFSLQSLIYKNGFVIRYRFYLIVHDDFVSHSVQQGGLGDELLLVVFVLLLPSLLYIVGCQGVQTCHLILLVVSVVQVAIDASSFQQLHKVFCFALLVVFQLQNTVLKRKCHPSEYITYQVDDLDITHTSFFQNVGIKQK